MYDILNQKTTSMIYDVSMEHTLHMALPYHRIFWGCPTDMMFLEKMRLGFIEAPNSVASDTQEKTCL